MRIYDTFMTALIRLRDRATAMHKDKIVVFHSHPRK